MVHVIECVSGEWCVDHHVRTLHSAELERLPGGVEKVYFVVQCKVSIKHGVIASIILCFGMAPDLLRIFST